MVCDSDVILIQCHRPPWPAHYPMHLGHVGQRNGQPQGVSGLACPSLGGGGRPQGPQLDSGVPKCTGVAYDYQPRVSAHLVQLDRASSRVLSQG